jgi:hypothetical protein
MLILKERQFNLTCTHSTQTIKCFFMVLVECVHISIVVLVCIVNVTFSKPFLGSILRVSFSIDDVIKQFLDV